MTRAKTTRVLTVAALALAVSFHAGAGEEPERRDRAFGEAMKLEGEALTAAAVLKAPEQYAGKELRIEGRVDQVCERRGCWLSLGVEGQEESIFVKFTCPISGRLIPVEAIGRQAMVEGKLELKEITEDMARHMAEEAGKSEAEVAAISGPQIQVNMLSPSALVRDLPLDANTETATP